MGIEKYRFVSTTAVRENLSPGLLLRPNLEGFVYTSWKEREGGGMEGRKQ